MGEKSFKALWICFPVWRELKLGFRLRFIIPLSDFGYAFPFEGNWNQCLIYLTLVFKLILWICFPVWRELKQNENIVAAAVNTVFGYAFPFEGNWNLLTLRLIVFFHALDMLSRLKGIETITTFQVLLEYLIYFGYGFPFEGNWNMEVVASVAAAAVLWICFPVWRELKRARTPHPPLPVRLWICFPVWRELKRV